MVQKHKKIVLKKSNFHELNGGVHDRDRVYEDSFGDMRISYDDKAMEEQEPSARSSDTGEGVKEYVLRDEDKNEFIYTVEATDDGLTIAEKKSGVKFGESKIGK